MRVLSRKSALFVIAHVVDDFAILRQAAHGHQHAPRRAAWSVRGSTDDGLRAAGVMGIVDFAMQSHLLVGHAPDTTSRAFLICGWRRAISCTCDGWTNMARTLVVWSARPIQPLMRVLVRPQANPAHRSGRPTVARGKADQRIVGIEDGDHDFAHFARRDGMPLPGWTISSSTFRRAPCRIELAIAAVS
jgi:hypothetical protein